LPVEAETNFRVPLKSVLWTGRPVEANVNDRSSSGREKHTG
jgi:hypothetical protein